MTRRILLFIVLFSIWNVAGCASLGCDVQPLKPKKVLRCQMPI